MSSKTIKHENENIIPDFINQQPIRLNMALSSSLIVPGEIMVMKLSSQTAAEGQNTDYFKQFVQIFVLFFRKFQIFLELSGVFYFVFHASSAAFRASMLV